MDQNSPVLRGKYRFDSYRGHLLNKKLWAESIAFCLTIYYLERTSLIFSMISSKVTEALIKNPLAPNFSLSLTCDSSSELENIMTGISLVWGENLSLERISKPSNPGSKISSMMISGFFSAAMDKAWLPSVA